MTIPIHCPKCGRFKPAPDQWAGKLVACDDCGARFQIPAKGAKRGPEPDKKPVARSSAARATAAPEDSHESPRATVAARCGSCGRQYDAPSDLAGLRCRCLHCGAVVEVPFVLTEGDMKPDNAPRS